MTQSTTKPFADFSDYQGDPILSDNPEVAEKALNAAKEDAAIAKALQEAKEAMKSKQEAPAVKAVKAKLVKPKAAKKATKKAGRVVGISADENKFLYGLLQAVLYDNNYATMINESQIAFDKLNARYNNK